MTFPGVLPAATAVAALVAAAGLPVERVADHATANSRWLFIGPQGRRDVDAAIAKLSNTHRIDARRPFRRISWIRCISPLVPFIPRSRAIPRPAR